ncbi:MAG TPA: hypothetical protein PK970_04115 [Hyphomicrobiaceae bacterium]|nr:hypothetical protein [Hyphomicrobiaceae bacterium]
MSIKEPEMPVETTVLSLPVASPLDLQDAGPAMLLADHLDATLAMAEDLSMLSLATASGKRTSTAFIALAEQARTLELGMVARLVQARKRAEQLDTRHEEVRRLIAAFVGGTAVVADAAQTEGGLGDVGGHALSSGAAALRFLKSRGVVAEDVMVIEDVVIERVGEDYLAAEMIHLGTLMDMLAAFLDALDVAFELYSPANRRN